MKVDPPEMIIIARYSKVKMGTVAILMFLLAWIGADIFHHPHKPNDIWVGIGIMTLGIIPAAFMPYKMFSDRRVQLSIGPDGLMWSLFSDNPIPWSEIDRIVVMWQGYYTRVFDVWFKNKDYYERAQTKARFLRVLNRYCITIYVFHLNVSQRHAFKALNYWIEKSKQEVAPSPEDSNFKNLEF